MSGIEKFKPQASPISGGSPGDGVESLNGLTGNVGILGGQNMSVTEEGGNLIFDANFSQSGKYLISGGAVWSGSGLIYDVSILSYFFNGLKTSPITTSVTLDASDPTFNRIDGIVVDEAGNVSVVKGDASSSPVSPAIDEDQLLVQFILVEAGSTTPTVQSESIYLDPTSNWTFSTYTTGTATGSINFAGTNSPKQGVNDIEASTDARLGARFVRDTSFDAYQYTMLQVWVRFTGTAVATNKALNVRFENSAGSLVGSTVNLFSYGLSRSILNTWQLVVVPITAFGALPATVKGMKMIMSGGTVGQVRQWDIDYMILTNGSVPFANVPTIAFYKDDVGIASQSGINIKQGTGVTIDAVNNPLYNRVDYTINTSNAISINGTTLYSSGLIGNTGNKNGENIIFGYNTGSGATNISNSNFLGSSSGYGATDAIKSNFIGYYAGFNATDANNSNFFGENTGYGASDADNSNFLGAGAGSGAINASDSNFLGAGAGTSATAGYDSNFFGKNAGYGAANASYSNFFGYFAGNTATNANNSNFIGSQAGYNANAAPYSNFIGYFSGYGATSATYSNFIGHESGRAATGASSSNFIGRAAGKGATSALYANFFGRNAGLNATNAAYGIFIGDSAGNTASSANNGVFLGQNAGYQATSASYSNFIGTTSGYQASGATTANFIGYGAGAGATNASYSNFLGRLAGNAAANAQYSNFIGFQAGYNATNAANSIFIGKNAGHADTVNNVGSGSSILIGESTSTGGFSNSIAIGKSATNTAENEMQIGSTSSKINTVVINGTGGIQVPVGTTAERSATQGTIRYNTTTSKFEGYDGSTWVDLN